jgi:hypothetical protein
MCHIPEDLSLEVSNMARGLYSEWETEKEHDIQE